MKNRDSLVNKIPEINPINAFFFFSLQHRWIANSSPKENKLLKQNTLRADLYQHVM